MASRVKNRARGLTNIVANFCPTSVMFGPGLQTLIYLFILAFKARHTNIMDITGAAAPCCVDKINMSGLGGQNNQIYHDLESRAKY